jgi:hypothetical protein
LPADSLALPLSFVLISLLGDRPFFCWRRDQGGDQAASETLFVLLVVERELVTLNEKPLIVAYRNTGTRKRALKKH